MRESTFNPKKSTLKLPKHSGAKSAPTHLRATPPARRASEKLLAHVPDPRGDFLASHSDQVPSFPLDHAAGSQLSSQPRLLLNGRTELEDCIICLFGSRFRAAAATPTRTRQLARYLQYTSHSQPCGKCSSPVNTGWAARTRVTRRTQQLPMEQTLVPALAHYTGAT